MRYKNKDDWSDIKKEVSSFKDLEFENDGFIKRAGCSFSNGYGASVIKGDHTYGGQEGLYELAVLDSKGDLSYDTPITGDVLGHLTKDDVTDYLQEIKNLPQYGS
tara:strand:- start:8526 stop:8840 length:315 start_codon:yes stop_codon:yes gene_type:complete